MLKAIEQSEDGAVKIYTERGEFVLSELQGGELTAGEVSELAKYNVIVPDGYVVKVQDAQP